MADIYQIPENSGNTPQFTIPIGGLGGNGGMFGNGFNSIADLFGLAIIASMFGWGNGNGFGGWGGNGNGAAGFLSNQINNDNGRDLIMQAVTNQGEASRTAIQTLSTMLGQDFNLVNSAVGNVQNALQTLALQQAVSVPQIINSIQSGDASLASAFQKCCCEAVSPEELYDTITHETKHVVEHISSFYDVDPKSEEAAYLQGEISKKMFPAVAMAVCPKCHNEKGEEH